MAVLHISGECRALQQITQKGENDMAKKANMEGALKVLRAKLREAADRGDTKAVVSLSTEIEALKASGGKVMPALNPAEKFILWALDQVENDPDHIKKGWKGIDVRIGEIPGAGCTVNQYLQHKLGMERDERIALTRDMQNKGLIELLPFRKGDYASVRIYKAGQRPVGAVAVPEFTNIPDFS